MSLSQDHWEQGSEAGCVAVKQGNLTKENDTNYIFLSFVTHYLPRGVIGLVLGVIFTAAMSAISGEINSLATVTVIDIYKRHLNPGASDHHYLIASRAATVFWGAFATIFATFAYNFAALIEAVNQVGSLFYGGLLGLFVCLTLRRTGALAFAIGFHAAFDFANLFVWSGQNGGDYAIGHLFNTQWQGAQWLTGGVLGPEASWFTLAVTLFMFWIFYRCYREKKFPPLEF